MCVDRPPCLTETEWVRLLSKQMDAAERARTAEHIGSCSQCADEYRLLQPLQSWVTDAERVLSPVTVPEPAAGPDGARGGRRLASRSP